MTERRVSFWYERPEPWIGFEMDVPDELFDDGREDELDEFICDNAPIREVYVEDWDWD